MSKTDADLVFFDYVNLRILSLDEKSTDNATVLLEIYNKVKDELSFA
jgi:hypothetical protein